MTSGSMLGWVKFLSTGDWGRYDVISVSVQTRSLARLQGFCKLGVVWRLPKIGLLWNILEVQRSTSVEHSGSSEVKPSCHHFHSNHWKEGMCAKSLLSWIVHCSWSGKSLGTEQTTYWLQDSMSNRNMERWGIYQLNINLKAKFHILFIHLSLNWEWDGLDAIGSTM